MGERVTNTGLFTLRLQDSLHFQMGRGRIEADWGWGGDQRILVVGCLSRDTSALLYWGCWGRPGAWVRSRGDSWNSPLTVSEMV